MSTSTTATRPAYPQHQTSSSTTSSVYQSSSSSVASLSSQPRSISLHPFQQSQAAPLPSPTSQPYNPFQNSYMSQQTSQSTTRRPEYRQEQSSRAGQAGSSDTGALLSQYNLVAEAAKRAQMAVLARDLDAMEF